MKNNNLEKIKKQIIEYIKKNPKTTDKDLRKNFHLHPKRIFKGGMAEIYMLAGVEPPRNFNFKSKEERKRLIMELIKKNPTISSFTIKKQLGINVPSAFNSIKEAYKEAGVKYPREKTYNKTSDEKKEMIIRLVKENPEITLPELVEKSKIKNIYRLFKNFEDIYKNANIKYISGNKKRKDGKIKQIINYIKNNPFVTQRDINKSCRTHVQELFKEGILEAYEKAGVNYPFDRRKVHGTALRNIKKRAKCFEDEIAIKLTGFGNVNKLVKIKRGIADIILERKDKKIVIEVKDYQLKEISKSQINQLNKYMEDINSNIGILICHKKPQKENFIIGENRIFVLEEQELYKILEIV